MREVYFDMRNGKSEGGSFNLTCKRSKPQHIRNSNSISLYEIGSSPGSTGDVKIGAQAHRSSAISAANPHQIVVRGLDLCRDLVGKITFTEHVWLLVTGKLPSVAQRRVLDSALVAIAEHGLVPSVVASRMTLAAAPEALQGAVAAGILGCGSVILGSAEAAARFFKGIADRGPASAAVREALIEFRDRRQPVPGYGHPLHKAQDPRVEALLKVATESGVAGRYIEIARAVESLVPEILSKALVMNVSAAIGAVLLDAGYPLLAVKGVPILARTASLIAHLLEEQERPIGFVLAHSGAAAIRYDGDSPEGFVPSEGSGGVKAD
jgi:citrate synthase